MRRFCFVLLALAGLGFATHTSAEPEEDWLAAIAYRRTHTSPAVRAVDDTPVLLLHADGRIFWRQWRQE
jgi:hypothetical protein